ncbi:MAG: 50S ribosomal protein L4 [Dehalococcoidales bacterium]|nr:MAG: 50S ribosomal protein L4 [Dehalococcoidales bacterium]
MQVPVYNTSGETVQEIELDDHVFGVPFNKAVVHQVMVRQLANARQGTASTKTRSMVTGSSRKLFRQKGTGWARAGSIKSPLRRGGGITFGAHPRNYRQAIPKKMRRLALRCVLSAKVNDRELVLVEDFNLDKPRTKQMADILTALGLDSSTLIVTAGVADNVVKSARNLPRVKTTLADLLNVVDLLAYKKLLMTVAAARRVEELWGGSDASLRSVAASADN